MLFRKLQYTEIDLNFFDDQPVLTILICREDLLEWIAILWLLLEELTTVTVLSKGGVKCFLDAGSELSVAKRNELINITIDKNNINYISSFLLRYFRDGAAEVEHLDIDAKFGSKVGYFTLKTDHFFDPVSGNDARKRLGI